MTLNDLFKKTTYDDTLFNDETKSAIESRIFMKTVRGAKAPYITCAIRNKEIKLTPEEAVRQLYIYKLMNEYGYAASRIQLETPIHFGREVKRADITIMDKDRPMVPYIIVELKKPKLTDGKEQLKSYCNATGAPIGVWTNGEQISCYNRKDPNFFEEISDIPKVTQKLSDIINEKFTYEDLKRTDKISTQKKSLRALIKEMEDEVLASAGVDSFEEIFKLIFAKLYDELICANDPTAYLQFRNNGNTDYELKEKIQGLFDDAKKKWEGIFTDESKILLSPSHLAVCVASLQDIKLFNNKKTARVLPEVLCVFLQSTIGQELIYRYVVGSTGIINIYDDDIAKIPIPVLDSKLQKDIATKVQESFNLRRQSKQLLEYAKQAVEMAIEQGEDIAMVWLESKVGQ